MSRHPFHVLTTLLLAALLTQCRQPAPRINLPFRVQSDGLTGYIDTAGRFIIPAVYHDGSDFSEGLAAVRPSGLYGYIDTSGKLTIPPQFDWAEPFAGGLAIVAKEGRYWYIRHDGQPAFPCPYQTLRTFEHGVAIVQTASEHSGLIDSRGRLLLDTVYDWITPFDEGLAYISSHDSLERGQAGIVDTLGHFVIPIGRYVSVSFPHQGNIVCEDDNMNQYVLDRTGKILLRRARMERGNLNYWGFSEGFASVSLRSGDLTYNGLIDWRNRLVLDDTSIKEVYPFSCGRAFVKGTNENVWPIDTQLRPVGNEQYSFVRDNGFVRGYAVVDRGEDHEFLIDTNARIVYQPADTLPHYLQLLGSGYFLDQAIDQHGSVRYRMGRPGGRLFGPWLDAIDTTSYAQGRWRVVTDHHAAVMDTDGSIRWRDTYDFHGHLQPLNTPCMLCGHFYAYTTPVNADDSEWIDRAAVLPMAIRQLPHRSFFADSLQLLIDTLHTEPFAQYYRGYGVYLANTTGQPQLLHALNSQLYLVAQAQDKSGRWRDINYLLQSDKEESYHDITLASDACWHFVMPQYDGAVPVNLRLQLTMIRQPGSDHTRVLYSNVIKGAINPAQYWRITGGQPEGMVETYGN